MVAFRCLQTPNFCATCENFVTVATGVGWCPGWMIPLHCWMPKNSTLVQESCTYLLYKPNYSQFYVQIVNFSLPWQQVRSGASLNDRGTGHLQKSPSVVQESGTCLLYRPSYSQFCVQIPKFLLGKNFTKSCSSLLLVLPSNKFT